METRGRGRGTQPGNGLRDSSRVKINDGTGGWRDLSFHFAIARDCFSTTPVALPRAVLSLICRRAVSDNAS